MITFDKLKDRIVQTISDRVFSRVMAANDPLDVNMAAIIKEETDKVVVEVKAALNLLEEQANDQNQQI